MTFSVVVPSYNHARFLETTIESVRSQTFTDWELLILDDQSSDDSLQIAQRYAAMDARIKVCPNETNLGTYQTQQRGTEMASGDWIAILNSDDVWGPDKLERQASILESNPDAAFNYTRCLLVDEDGQPLPNQNHHRNYPTEPRQEILPWLLHTNQVAASSLVFRKGAVQFEASFGYSGDWVAALRLAQQGPAAFVNEPVTHWRQHGDNSSKKLLRIIGEEVSVRRWILAHAATWAKRLPAELQAIAARQMAWTELELSAHLFLLGKSAEAIQMSLNAARHGDPTVKQVAIKRALAMRVLPRKKVLARFLPGQDDPEELAASVVFPSLE